MRPCPALASAVLLAWSAATAAAADPHADPAPAFLKAHCVKCHGPEKPKGGVRLDGLAGNYEAEADAWAAAVRAVRAGDMPPAREPRPDPAAADRFDAAVEVGLARVGKSAGRAQPQYGNDVPHAALFDPANARLPGSTPARYWRMSPNIYRKYVLRQHPSGEKLVAPFNPLPGDGFKDYALPAAIDEPTTSLLWLNAEALVGARFKLNPKTGKLDKPPAAAYAEAFDDAVPAVGDAKLAEILDREFQQILGRGPAADERARWLGLLKRNVEAASRPAGLRLTIAALYLHPEVLYRRELGEGPADAHGRRMLSPRELTFAVAYALGDRWPDDALLKAAAAGRLATRADVAREVDRILNDPAADKSRVMRFFREYFGYHTATTVFKDAKPYYPDQAVRDTDALVARVLDADREVIAELLATDTVLSGRGHTDPSYKPYVIYGLSALPEGAEKKPVPVSLPPGQRAGVLTQPSWLIARSTNFENHPIARGHWVRERLLGGTLPEIPLTVDAKLPDDKDKTLRQRMQVTRDDYCWRCHQKMDPLGLPFEMYSHTGVFRAAEAVAAPGGGLDPKTRKPVTRDVPVDATGAITGTGEPGVDGPVANAVDMMKKLARSERVEQVFVRHAFRYWMGRNETVSDAGALQAAHKAYKESGGSFRALLVSLLTSDPFLYRSGVAPPAPAVGKPK